MNQRSLIVSAALLAGVGCHETTGPRPDNSRPVLSRHADTLTAIGDTLRLAVNNSSADLVWESRNQQIAMVTQTGRVTAMSKGESWVLVFRQPGIADSALIVIDQKVATVTVTPASISRPLNRTQQFLVLALDANGVQVPGVVTWSASGNAATITPNGVATANALGTATIQATVQGVVGSATLSVSPLPSLRLTLDTIDIGTGQYANGALPALYV